MGLVIVLMLGLASCGSTGRDFDTTHVTDIQNNSTTQAEIKQWFGKPFNTGHENNLEMWTYQFDGYSSVGKGESKDLIIMFDDNGIVKAYRYSTNMNP